MEVIFGEGQPPTPIVPLVALRDQDGEEVYVLCQGREGEFRLGLPAAEYEELARLLEEEAALRREHTLWWWHYTDGDRKMELLGRALNRYAGEAIRFYGDPEAGPLLL